MKKHWTEAQREIFKNRELKETKELGTLKILSEKEEVMCILNVEMDDALVDALLKYALDKITVEEENEFYINWAFNDILKKQIKEFKKIENKVPEVNKKGKK